MKQSEKPVTPRHADMMLKICGMRDPENIMSVSCLTPMLIGFIFHAGSPRNAEGLDPKIVKDLPPYVRPVAVFVNATAPEITDITTRYGIRVIQLHGEEPPQFCSDMRRRGFAVIKAIKIPAGADSSFLSLLEPYRGNVDMLLFDTSGKAPGGNGYKFDWSLLDNYSLDIPYMLSGGIGPDDINAVKEAMKPGLAGIDLNSRFETSPGFKDVAKLSNFIIQLRKLNEHEPIDRPFWEKA
ncbi:MAG: phosphoribosylanthranilate isomerase [Muribaculaceae bacterium]|nr:phosphoribosylanthranilate isomerase [Muribaculaceae bacterium]